MKMTLKLKLVLILVAFTLIPASIQFYITYQNNVKALHEKSFENLLSIRENKSKQISDLFKVMGNQVQVISKNPLIKDSIVKFSHEYNKIEESYKKRPDDIAKMKSSLEAYYTEKFATEYMSTNNNQKAEGLNEALDTLGPAAIALQYHYISNNKNPLGSKHLLTKAKDGSEWSNIHEKNHPFLKNYLETFGYYDIFLVDIDTGAIVYSVYKELDFGTSLISGPYKDTNFAQLFNKIKDSDNNSVQVVDLDKYFPSYQLPAGFIGVPVYNNNKKVGALIFQIPVEKIDAIMTSNKAWKKSGYGDSGEVYLVGKDLKMRSLSRFLAEDSVNYFKLINDIGTNEEVINYIKSKDTTTISQVVDTEGVRAAFEGKVGNAVFNDYRGVAVMSSYNLLDLYGLKWAIMSEIDEEEVLTSINDLSQLLVLTILGMTLFGVGIAWYTARKITNPIISAAEAVKGMADGNLDQHVECTSQDEVGDMALSINDTLKKIENTFGSKKVNWVNLEEMKKAEAKARKEAKAEAQQAKIAKQQADEAMNTAQEEKRLAETAKSEAQEAQSLVEAEKKNAQEAMEKAKDALKLAEIEKEKGQKATKEVERAKVDVEKALKDAQIQKENAQVAEKSAQEEKDSAKIAKNEAQVAKEEALRAQNLAGQSNKKIESLLLKSKEEADELQEKVKSILHIVDLASKGNLTQKITVVGEDPIGKVGRGLKTFFENISDNLIEIDHASRKLGLASEELKTNGEILKENSHKTDTESSNANGVSTDVNTGMSNLRTEIDEFIGSIRDITQTTSEAIKLTNAASEKSDSANMLIKRLGESSSDIGSVIKLIASIAQQTNLLALNATIEAARAGDAGRGFAVVANEVKELAKQTASASDEITQKIEAIQNDSIDAVSAIGEIAETIEKVNENTNNISVAVTKQTETSNIVSKIVNESASNVGNIVGSVQRVQESAKSTLEAADKNTHSADELSLIAENLNSLVGHFELGDLQKEDNEEASGVTSSPPKVEKLAS
jgi:methyl-accepting chemotaxis protein